MKSTIRKVALATALTLGPFASTHLLRAQQAPIGATPQRPTFTTDTNITSAGTVELEFGFEGNNNSFDLPTTLKFTPVKLNAELSVNYDSLISNSEGSGRVTQFTDHVTEELRKPFFHKGPIAFAATVLVTEFTTNEQGLRAGGTLHANLSGKWAGLVVNETYTRATNPSPANLEHLWDTAATLTINLPDKSNLSRFTPFVSVLNERGNDHLNTLSTMYGSYFKIHSNLYIDGSVRELNNIGGLHNQQIVFGLVKNFGKFKR